jgi:hypothetical protein
VDGCQCSQKQQNLIPRIRQKPKQCRAPSFKT